MVKFSISKDDGDDEFNLARDQPKRRRTSTVQPAYTPQPHPIIEETEDLGQPGEPDSSRPTVSLILSDSEVLDCPICFDPLTFPVYQCENGHIACSSCCGKLNNKCPSCCMRLGPSRCRAIEKVIESVKVSCFYSGYGCESLISYCQRHKHEQTCIYAPCLCPVSHCPFRGSAAKLSQHITAEHCDSVVRFFFNRLFPVSEEWDNKDEKFLVLREGREGRLFVVERQEGTLNVKCLEACPDKGRFRFVLVVRSGSDSLRFQSYTKCIEPRMGDPLSSDCLLLPFNLYVSDIEIELCVWSKNASCPDITDSI